MLIFNPGYLKSSIHRVVAPPPDQAHLDRLGLLYFLRLVKQSSLYVCAVLMTK
jgi:isopenicillin N synthase-like dioxygenase